MKAAILFAALCFELRGQDSPVPMLISGTVVNAVTGDPLAKVRVVITTPERKDQPLGSVTTQSDGRFRFSMARRNYSLSAEKNGWGRQVYGQRNGIDYYGVALIAEGTKNPEDLIFRMFPPSAITGRVVDTSGEAVEGALVQLLRSTVVAGQKKLLTRGYFYTDDRGEYRFGNLAAGSYYLVVGGTPWHSKGGGYGEMAYVPLYYPNTQDPNAAAPLVLRAGEEGTANFNLLERPGGSITILVAGELNAGAKVNLTAVGIKGLNRYQHVGTVYGARHLISAVPPGSYDVLVTGESKGQVVMGTARVDVGETSQEVRVTVGALPKVAGTVSCNGQPVPSGSPIVVNLVNEATQQGLSRRVGPEGSFQFPGVSPGSYRVILFGSKDCDVARVVLDGKELQNRSLPVGGTDIAGVTIDGRGGAGVVKGFVRSNGAKSSGVFVFLAPVKGSTYPSDYASFKTDSDGSYDFRTIRPGEYWLYAVDEEEFEYMDAKLNAPYLKRAEKVTLLPAGTVEKDIELLRK